MTIGSSYLAADGIQQLMWPATLIDEAKFVRTVLDMCNPQLAHPLEAYCQISQFWLERM